MTVLEIARHQPDFEHLVYASSSSVYGGNTKLPFSVDDPTDTPVSLYAATKKADELMSHSYSHLYRIPQTGLRWVAGFRFGVGDLLDAPRRLVGLSGRFARTGFLYVAGRIRHARRPGGDAREPDEGTL